MCNKECWFKQTDSYNSNDTVTRKWYNCTHEGKFHIFTKNIFTWPRFRTCNPPMVTWVFPCLHNKHTEFCDVFKPQRKPRQSNNVRETEVCGMEHFHPSLRVWWVSHIFELRCLVKAEITPERRSTVSFDFFTCDTAFRNVFGGLIWKPQLGVLSLRSVCNTERPRAVDAEFLALCTTAWHFSRFRSLLFSNTPSFRGAPWEPSGNVSSPMEKNTTFIHTINFHKS